MYGTRPNYTNYLSWCVLLVSKCTSGTCIKSVDRNLYQKIINFKFFGTISGNSIRTFRNFHNCKFGNCIKKLGTVSVFPVCTLYLLICEVYLKWSILLILFPGTVSALSKIINSVNSICKGNNIGPKLIVNCIKCVNENSISCCELYQKNSTCELYQKFFW